MTNRVIYQPEPPFIVEVAGDVVTDYQLVETNPVETPIWEFHSAYFTEQDARGRADELAEHTFYVRVVLRHDEGRDRN